MQDLRPAPTPRPIPFYWPQKHRKNIGFRTGRMVEWGLAVEGTQGKKEKSRKHQFFFKEKREENSWAVIR